MSCFGCVQLFATPWTVALQVPLTMGFSRQEYWSGLPVPSPGDLPNPGIEPMSLMSTCIGRQVLYHEGLLGSPSFFFFFLYLFIYFICSEFCHTLEWKSHGFTCVPHPDPPSHLPLHPLLLGFPSAPGPSACLMHPTWAGDLFHPRYCTCFNAVLLKHPTLSFSHRV